MSQMSGNQKQAPSAVPQPQQRFPQGQAPYAFQAFKPPTIGTDGFHVQGPQPFVQQQPPNPVGNQGPGLRGMAPTGPPTQASTPPNADLKVQQHVQQQPPMNMTYVQQRPGQNFYRGGPPPQSQPQRISVNTRPQQQQIYPTQSISMMPGVATPMFFNMPYGYSSSQRPTPPAYVSQNFQLIPSTQLAATYSYPTQSQQYFYNHIGGIPRQPPPQQQVQSVPQNMTHPPPQAAPLPTTAQQNPGHKGKMKRSKAIPIIDPSTGKEVMNDDEDSHPASGESSARQTPQPTLHNSTKEVQATFAKQVAQRINDDVQATFAKQVAQRLNDDDEEQQTQSTHEQQHIDTSNTIFVNVPSAHSSNRIDLLQNNKIQVPSKEFVPANQISTSVETPIVSALISTGERIIVNKPLKEKESPNKGRKPREQSSNNVEKENTKDSVKEKEPIVQEKAAREDHVRETVPQPPTVQPTPVSAEQRPSPKCVKEPETPVEENKVQKNEKAEVKTNLPETISASPDPVSAPVETEAKAKQTSHKGKDSNKVASNASVPPKMQVPVPTSQPTKASSKSSKIKEINLKGATKEGTDMDAFNDNTDIENTNLVNVNNSKAVESSTPPQIEVVTDSNKSAENEETVPVKTEIKPPVHKVDVAQLIFKDTPRTIMPPPAAPVEVRDEVDKASTVIDKTVQAKNEVNSKNNINDNEEIIETRPTLPYKDDQWSPNNKDGKKVYERDFLMALRNYPQSKVRPGDLLNDIIAQEDRSRLGDVSRYSLGGRADFAPNFGGVYSGKSPSQRGSMPATKRGGSQHGGKVSSNQKGGKSSSIIRVSISFKEDVKLHESENAWKPARQNPGSAQPSEEDKKTADLYKRVRGVLNKLTPQKFDTLVSQIKSLPIDTKHRLQGVIDLVFDKAVDEPNFSVAYALMCKEVALMNVPVTHGSDENVNFRKLLITRCQMEFEKNSNEERNRNEKLKEVEKCTDPEKKKEMLLVLDEEERKVRMKSVGNIRFIGELFKQKMLTTKIMTRCLHNLLENRDEDRLECLCKLLTTIGRELVMDKVDLSPIFNVMKDIVDRKDGCKVSSRVRFMLQDVIDLRLSNWVPRRTDMNPRTIDQIQKEAENEHLTIQAMNSGPITPRKDDRGSSNNDNRKRGGGGGGGSSGGGNRNAGGEEGWSTATSRNKGNTFTFHSDKLKIKQPNENEPLGSSLLFGIWGRGSNTKTPSTNTANKFAALERISDGDSRSMSSSGPRSRDPYTSKGPSLEYVYKQYDGRGSRSGSRQRSNESSQRNTPTPMQQPPAPKPETVPTLDTNSEAFQRKVKNILEEYLNDCCHIDDTFAEVRSYLTPSAQGAFIIEISNVALDRSKKVRLKTGKLFALLIQKNLISLEAFSKGLEQGVFANIEDYIVDIPNICECYAEMIYSPLNEQTFSFNQLQKCAHFVIQTGYAHKLLSALFKIFIAENPPSHLHDIWKSSKLSLKDFMEPNMTQSFIHDNNVQFLVGSGENTSVGRSDLTYEQIQQKLSEFLVSKVSKDNINQWILANVGDRMQENKFIRVLVTAIIESSINHLKLDVSDLRQKYSFFTMYLDGKSEFELQALYAIQAIVNKLEYPQGLLLKIFNTLYEDNVISLDSFTIWENSPEELENKGVALKQLVSFFTQLFENDEEEESDSSVEA